jgi:pimeloyl-ACP methyl ester carboxylesterase
MADAEAPAPRDYRFSARDGLRLFWREYGDPLSDATPILCLPGLTRNGKDFAAFASHHAPGRRVLCPDYRGRGRSGYAANWRSYSPETCLDDLMHLMAVADVHRCIVVGASFGGLLGVGLAAAMPSALTALVMNDIGPEIEFPSYTSLLDVIGRDHPLASWDDAVPALRAMFPRLVFRDERSWEAAARNTWREGDDGLLHADWDPALAKPLQRTPPPAPLWGLFRAVRRIPVLALRGEYSDMLSVTCFDRMAAEKPDILRVTVTGAGHTPTLDEPDARKALDDFLASV